MKSNMAKMTSIILMIAIVLSGCSSISDEKNINDENITGENKEELNGTLTVTTLFDGYIDIHAENFMKIHPNVDIQVVGSDENQFETLEGYANRISTELMTGKSTDLVDISGLDVNRYVNSGILSNLYDFMNYDTEFDKSDYYTNIFKALEYNNNLYAMPFAFLYDMIYLSKPLSEGLELDSIDDGIDYTKMVEIYSKAEKYYQLANSLKFMPGAVKESFFNYEVIEFYDSNNKTAWIDGKDFIQYLKLTKSIYTGYSPNNQGGWYMTRIGDGNDSFMKSDFMFSKFESNSIDLYNMMIEYENILGPMPLLNSSGNAPFNTFASMYAIPEGSPNKELAWEFLKYCISAKDVTDFENEEDELLYFMMYQGWIPISKDNFHTSFRHNFENEIERIQEAGFDVKWKSDDKEKLINDALDQINQWNSERNKLVSDFELWTLLKSDLENYYYYNLTTAEDTAKIIQNKVNSYLNE